MATDEDMADPPARSEIDLESTARLPTLVDVAQEDDHADTGTWSDSEGPFADFSGARITAMRATIEARDSTVAQLQARLAESETWAAQLAQELERLRPLAAAQSEAELGELRRQLEELGQTHAAAQATLQQAEAALAAADALAQRHAAERDAAQAALEPLRAELDQARADAARALAAPVLVTDSAQPHREELRSQALQIETLLERLRTMEARHRYAADFRHTAVAPVAPAADAGLRERVADLEAEAARTEAAVAEVNDRARIAEAGRAEVEAAAQARERELQDKIAALEDSVVASAVEIGTLREREVELRAELAARSPESPAVADAPAESPPEPAAGLAPVHEPTIVIDDGGTLAQRFAVLSTELERRNHRIHVLEAELASHAEALQTIRRGLGMVPEERSTRVMTPSGKGGPRYLLRLDDGSRRLHVLHGARCTVGRTPENDIEIRESFVSRAHAVFKLGAEATVVEDIGSTNGVYVNDQRVHRQLLRDGDLVSFGRAQYRFHTSRPTD